VRASVRAAALNLPVEMRGRRELRLVDPPSVESSGVSGRQADSIGAGPRKGTCALPSDLQSNAVAILPPPLWAWGRAQPGLPAECLTSTFTLGEIEPATLGGG
jgi:hypothetical protein